VMNAIDRGITADDLQENLWIRVGCEEEIK
jgi:hypothetical protein